MRMKLQKLMDKLRLQSREPKKLTLADKLSDTELEFLPGALEVVESPPSPIGRALAWILISLFTVAILWAIFGKVDEVAVAPGKLIPTGYTKTIQAEDKGVVKAIYVKDGSKVKAGEILIELDTTFTAADLARLEKERAYFQLELSRLFAEQVGEIFSPEANANVDPQDVQSQLHLYKMRMNEFQSKAAAANQMVKQAQAALDIAEVTKRKLAAQLEIATDKEQKMLELFQQGAESNFRYQDYRERRMTLHEELSAQYTEIVKATHAVQQSRESLQSIVDERERDIATKVVEDRRQLKNIEEELKKAQEKHRLSVITAPIDGTVQQLAMHTIGGIVTSAQPLMLIVPGGEKLEVEAWVANKDIGFVYEGQTAEIKVETFNFQKFGTLSATLVKLSSDAIEDKDKGLVYRALLQADQDHVVVRGKKVYLSPGMAVTAEIKTRQKQVIEYFMDTFIKYKSEGLRER